MRKMCKDCLHYEHCINIPNYPVSNHTLGCDDWEKDIRDKLAEYEDLEEQGLLLRLPVKVGDTVYIPFINRIIEKRVISIIVQRSFIVVYCENNSHPFSCEDFGKTVFLTREEAEQKLKELEG